jgi:hypothetical protein
MTWLCRRDDFPDLVEAAAIELRISPAIVEKDYYATEALRVIAGRFGDVVLLKGGTSLSKGWKLIQRFSEDIDLYVQPVPSSTRATDRRLKSIADAVGQHPMLSRDEVRKRAIGGLGRDEYFAYSARTTAFPGLEAVIKLEAGIQSGTQPWEERTLSSLLAEFLDSHGVPRATSDRVAFPLKLLHYRRTFVEKLFTIHDKIERQVKQDRGPLGSFARHYYDTHQLMQTAEVQAMLRSGEYAEIAVDYRRLTRTYFPRQALPPLMSLRQSSALFPDPDLRNELGRDYDDQCTRLCYGRYPPFDDVLDAFQGIREYLVEVPEVRETKA